MADEYDFRPGDDLIAPDGRLVMFRRHEDGVAVCAYINPKTGKDKDFTYPIDTLRRPPKSGMSYAAFRNPR